MSRHYLIIGAVLALATAGLVRADTPPAASGTLSPDQAVKGRQAALKLSAGVFGSMKAAVDAGAPITDFEYGSRGLANWARTLPSLFPAGSGRGDPAVTVPTKALPEIWTHRADFEQKAADYAAAADKLADLAKAGDKEGWLAQWAVVRGACSACHDVYRARPPAAPAPAAKS